MHSLAAESKVCGKKISSDRGYFFSLGQPIVPIDSIHNSKNKIIFSAFTCCVAFGNVYTN